MADRDRHSVLLSTSTASTDIPIRCLQVKGTGHEMERKSVPPSIKQGAGENDGNSELEP